MIKVDVWGAEVNGQARKDLLKIGRLDVCFFQKKTASKGGCKFAA